MADVAVRALRYAEVAVDAPAGYDRTFSYSIPDNLDVRPGHLVHVPFGPRKLQGLVFSLARVPQVARTRTIISISALEPALTDKQLALARWMSQHYMCSLFEAAAPMLPPGGRLRAKTYLSISPSDSNVATLELSALQRRVVEYVHKQGSADQERLATALGEAARLAVRSLVGRKVLVSTTGHRRPSVGTKFRDMVVVASNERQHAVEWLPVGGNKAPRQAAFLARLLDDDASLSLADARKRYGASSVNAVLAKGWVEKQRTVLVRDPLANKSFAFQPPATLTPRQRSITLQIRGALDGGSASRSVFLVQGVTGSGKTEIYLDAVRHCMKLGRSAIVLVPEIALTHQTVERFAGRFPGRVAVFHSRLTAGERFDQWWRIKHGEFGVVIGSRSAIFAPVPDLGLVVIDEEHEWTYKQQDAAPRYHARDVALKMADLTGVNVVLGSASPDVVSYHSGLRREFRLLKLPDRFRAGGDAISGEGSKGTMASVEVVDMRQELREGNSDIFSRSLRSAMHECHASGAQMILFLNRRGSASYMQCRSCGADLRCTRCDIALTYHRDAGRLLCHYCGYKRIPPAKCPRCLSYRISYYGVGTQTIVEEAARLLPRANVLRWDRDVTRRAGAYEDLLEQFRSGKAQVLVGTQMIAKGLHFPSVTLVGVVSADVGLNIPDYRAGERAFQVLCQVAGRAGRGTAPGRVIIQTYQPDNYAIRAAAAQDYQSFYRREVAFRRERANPPYSRLIRLVYAHTNRALCEREAQRLGGIIREQRDAWGYSDTEILGPTPAYPPRLRGHYRWHIVLRGPEPRTLLDKVTVAQGWTVDVDPVALT